MDKTGDQIINFLSMFSIYRFPFLYHWAVHMLLVTIIPLNRHVKNGHTILPIFVTI